MGKLTKEQADALAELEALRDAPDEEPAGPAGRMLNVTVDLGDDAAVERAFKLGFLTAPDADEPEPEPDADAELEDGPKRRGFFPEAKSA